MSIQLAVAQIVAQIAPVTEATRQAPAWLPLLLAPLGLLVAWMLRSLRWRSIDGPARLAGDDPIGRIWAVTILGLISWLFVPAIFILFVHGQISDESELSSSDKLKAAIVGQACAVFALLAANGATRPGSVRRLGLAANRVPRGLLYGILALLAAIPLTIAASAAVQLLMQSLHRPTLEDHELIQVFRSAGHDVRTMVTISAALLAPAFEEIFFRGHIQTALSATFAAIMSPLNRIIPTPAMRWLAILITSALFASAHGFNWMWAPLYLLSLCLGYAYERTGNLWVPIAMHAGFNGLSLLMAMAQTGS